MFIKRATSDIKYKEYCNEESYLKNLSYISLDEKKNVIMVVDFTILNQFEAKIIHYKVFNHLIDFNDELLNQFIDEFLYWNPFIKTVYFKDEPISIKEHVDIFKLPILEIQIEQLTVSKTKLENAFNWIQSCKDVIICVVKIDDQFVCIDGYSRLLAAYLKGYKEVYCYIEIDDYDELDYREFLKWCQDENIYTVKDLMSRVVSDDEHQRIWIDRCQNYFKHKK